MAIGGRGVISVVSNEIPKEMAQMMAAVEQNDFAAARTIHAQKLKSPSGPDACLRTVASASPSASVSTAVASSPGNSASARTARRRTSTSSETMQTVSFVQHVGISIVFHSSRTEFSNKPRRMG